MKSRCSFVARAGWLMLAAMVLSAGGAMAAEAAKDESFKTRHVVILVMDGARYTETWGDAEHKYIPRIFKELAPQGVVFTNFRNQGQTETVPGHTALCTGIYQTKMNNKGAELPDEPSIFQYLLKQTGCPASKAWIDSSKDKLVVLADCGNPAWKGKFRPSADCGKSGDGKGGYRNDGVTFTRAKEILTRDAPTIMIINFKDPDSCGHANKWKDYLAAIKQTDAYAADLWLHIQADATLKDSTALFVVNDHGRHTESFVKHGDNCDGCRHVLCVALGPDFPKGVVNPAECGQTDVTATAARLLNVDMPTGTGKSLPGLIPQPGKADGTKPAPAEPKRAA
jgi:hypothetical protein